MHGTHDAGGDTPRTFTVTSIGVIRNERTEPIDDNWDLVNSTIELDLRVVGADATRGLGEFSHVEVVFLADRVDPGDRGEQPFHPPPSRSTSAGPRWVFLAQRHRERINLLGVTVCELMAVRPGGVIEVRGWTPSTALRCSTSSPTTPSTHRGSATSSSPTGATN